MSMDKRNASDNEETSKFSVVQSRKRRRISTNHMEVQVINGIEEQTEPDTFFERTGNLQGGEQRTVSVPAHRYTLLKENWLNIFTLVVDHLQLQIRFDQNTKNVELQAAPESPGTTNLQKGVNFVTAFTYGFEIEDALALLRLDDQFIETFDIQDVEPLEGDRLSREIGRLAGKEGGITKFTIEKVTKTKIVLVDSKIHILGSFKNIELARYLIYNLILVSLPLIVYEQLMDVASREY